MDIFNADQCQTALGKKLRAKTIIKDCDYCKEGKDIFNKKEVCPFCLGSLKRI